MTPATVEDAYSMLLEAVAIDDPVIFCEHKYLYYHLKAEQLQEMRHAGQHGQRDNSGTVLGDDGGNQLLAGAEIFDERRILGQGSLELLQ